MPLLSDLRQRARDLKTETIALYLARAIRTRRGTRSSWWPESRPMR
jgi:hypothetical protein